MENPYDEDIERYKDLLVFEESWASQTEERWHALNKERDKLPRWRMFARFSKKKEIFKVFEEMGFAKYMVIYDRQSLNEAKRKREELEYVRGEK